MLTHDDLKRLAAVSGPCLTIIQPLRDTWSQVTKPETRIAAAIQEAGRLLDEKGFDAAERDEMLRPLRKIAANTEWSGRTGSFVMFRSPEFTLTGFWPDELAPRVHFAEEFLVLPLLDGLLRDRSFWLLALSIKSVKLYRGSGEALSEVALPAGVATSLAEDQAFDTPDHSLRGRSTAGPSVGSMKGVQFTTGAAHEGEPTYLHDFFRAIDRGIHPLLARDPHPLILAGVTRQLAIYRKVNTWTPLIAEDIHGSTETFATDFLFAKGAELAGAFATNGTDATLHDLDAAMGRGLLESDPEALIEAAGSGQVAELVIEQTAAVLPPREAFINWNALATVRGGGRIRFVKAPLAGDGVAAILRYRPAKAGQPAPTSLVA
jgi:hypothetical protein